MTPPSELRWDIGLLWTISVGVLGYMAFATAKGQPVDASTCFVVLTLIVGAIKERWLSRSIDRMSQNLADAPPVSDANKPSGTKKDPMHVAGTDDKGDPPVITKTAGGK